MSAAEKLTQDLRQAQEAANFWDAKRRALRRICDPIDAQCAAYKAIIWLRLYGEPDERSDLPAVPQDHPGWAMSKSEIHAAVDALRLPHRAELTAYKEAQGLASYYEREAQKAAAALDNLNKVPLRHARKAPRRDGGAPSLFSPKGRVK